MENDQILSKQMRENVYVSQELVYCAIKALIFSILFFVIFYGQVVCDLFLSLLTLQS